MQCDRCGEVIQFADQRFCTGCGTEQPWPFKLFVKHRRTLRHDAPGMLTCWVQLDSSTTESATVELSVSSPKLGHLSGNCGAVSIAGDGKTSPLTVTVDPLGVINDAEVEFFVTLNQHWIARGTHRLSVIEPPNEANIAIHTQGGDVSGNGARLSDNYNINLHGHDAAPTVPDETHEVRVSPVLKHADNTELRSLRLTLPNGETVTLVGATEGLVTLGRSSRQDIVLRAGIGELDRQISNKHARIEFGETVTWTEIPSETAGFVRYGTERDGERLIDGEPYHMQTGAKFLLAQSLTIVPTLLEGALDPAARQTDERHARRLGTQVEPQRGRTTAVRLDVTNAIGEVGQYLLIPRAVRIGSNADCPLRVIEDDVRSFHARLVYLAGRFWIEPSQKDACVEVRGEIIPFGHRVALQPNDEIVLGTARFSVHADTSRKPAVP